MVNKNIWVIAGVIALVIVLIQQDGKKEAAPFADLMLHYTFDNNAVTDSSGNGYTALLLPGGVGAYESTVGIKNNGMFFNLADGEDYIEMNDIFNDMDPTKGTISLWVKMDSSIVDDSQTHQIVTLGGTTGRTVEILKSAQNTLRIQDHSTAGVILNIDDISAFDDEYQHIAVTWRYDGTNRALDVYHDGARVASGTYAQTDYTETFTGARIGASAGIAGDFYMGSLDELRVYDKILSLSEVQSLYFEGRPLEQTSVRFIHLTDPHLTVPSVAGGLSCGPSLIEDGRTDCGRDESCTDDSCRGMIIYTDPEDLATYVVDGTSSLPNQAFESAISSVNSKNPDFTIITGDITSYGKCDSDKRTGIYMYKYLADRLRAPYHNVIALYHDGGDNAVCQDSYTSIVGKPLNWNFRLGGNIFVGLSEAASYSTATKFDTAYLSSILESNKDQNLRLFVFTHTGLNYCNSDILGEDFICDTDDVHDLLVSYSTNYREIYTFAGHNHANTYDNSEGIHHFTTTSTMNYPSQYRIVDITNERVSVTMSESVDSEVDRISRNIMESVQVDPARTITQQTNANPQIYYGDSGDRDVYIPPLPVEQSSGGGGGGRASLKECYFVDNGTCEYNRIYEWYDCKDDEFETIELCEESLVEEEEQMETDLTPLLVIAVVAYFIMSKKKKKKRK